MVTFKQLSSRVYHLHAPSTRDEKTTRMRVLLSGGGSIHEAKEKAGISHLLEHVIVNRYNKMDAETLEHFFNSKVIYHNASTSREHIEVLAEGHRDDTFELFDIVATQALRADIIEDAFVQQKKIVLSEIDRTIGSASYKLSVYTDNQLFNPKSPEHNYPIGGPETVESIHLDDIKMRYNQMLSQSSIMFVTAGGSLSETILDDMILERTKDLPIIPNILPIRTSRSILLNDFDYLPIVHEYGHEHAVMKIYIPFDSSFTHYAANNILRQILFRIGAGILYNVLRTRLGIIYALNSSVVVDDDLLVISVTTNEAYVQTVIDELKKVIMSTDVKTLETELETIRSVVRKREELAHDGLFEDLEYAENIFFIYGQVRTTKDYIDMICNVTMEELLQALNHLKGNLDQMQVAIISKNQAIADLKLTL